MKCSEIIKKLEELAPPSYACDWDNVGLLSGRSDKEVKKILIALDGLDEVIDMAVQVHADMVITHHPLIFKPLKRINDEDFIGLRLMKLIEHGISYYAMHTNFDVAPGCMADLAAGKLELVDCSVLEVTGQAELSAQTGEKPVPIGIGRKGRLPEPMTVKELGAYIKDRFDLPFLTVYGGSAVTEPITYVAVAPGSGKGSISYALDAGVQVLITGDIGHHDGIDAAANHMMIMDAGHYGLEHIFVDFMEEFLRQELEPEMELLKAAMVFPAVVL